MRKPFCMELAGRWLRKILIHLGGADSHISLTVGREQRINFTLLLLEHLSGGHNLGELVFSDCKDFFFFFFLFNSKLAFYVLVSARVFIVML